MDLTGQVLLGKYEIANLLGRGGMGAVFSARHLLTGRKLAVKVLDDNFAENEQIVMRFGREARAASAIQHPGIVEVLDLDQTEEGIPFLVMEYLEGETLASRIEKRGRLDQAELVRLGQMLLEALAAAHAHGVVHRDLKPENIYVVPAGRKGEIVKILDFGISHMDEGLQKLTMTGSVLGTPHYMSPEQATGEATIDQRADVYSAGVVLYECAVGDVPFDAPNYNRLLRCILDEEPSPPRTRGAEISRSVERVITRAMVKDPKQRTQTAQAMLEMLITAAATNYDTDPLVSEPPPAAAADAAPELGEMELVDVVPPAASAAPSARAAEGSGGWNVSPALQQIAARRSLSPVVGSSPAAPVVGSRASLPTVSSLPPRTASGGAIPALRGGVVNLDDDPLRNDLAGSDALELDESAFRPNSSGALPAIVSVAPAAPAAIGSLPPRSSTSSAEHPRLSASAPARTSIPGGPLAEPAVARPGIPQRFRYLALALGAIFAFVIVVFIVNRIVDPGVDEATLNGTAEPPPPPPPPPPDPEPAVPSVQFVSVRVVGLPPGARVLLDGLPAVGTARLRMGGQHVIEITAPGYQNRHIEFEADEDRVIPAGLRPLD